MRFPPFSVGPLEFGSRYISTYSVMFTLAIITVVFLAYREAQKKDRKEVLILSAYCFISGMLLSRLFYVLFFKDLGWFEGLIYLIDPTRSGLTSYGAFAGAIFGALIFYTRRRPKARRMWRILDCFSPGVVLGIAVGRLGCHFAGCCYGLPTDASWGIYYKDALRHPTQAYDMLNGLVVFLLNRGFRRTITKKLFPGALLLLTLATYSLLRIAVESYRVGPRIGALTYNQLGYLLLMFGCLAVFYYRFRRSR